MLKDEMNPENETGAIVGTEPHVVSAIHTRSFHTKDAAAAVGISVGKLQNWLTRGAIQMEGAQNPGRGQSRNYSAYEVARIALMKRLSDCGVPLETSFRITSALKDTWKQVAGGAELYGTEPNLQSWLIVLLANDWPLHLRRSIVRADDHIAVWIVDEIAKPDPRNGLTATLLALNGAAAIVVNMGKLLHETLTKLMAVPTE